MSSYPKGLSWSDGYAFDGTFHYFVCQKSGHKRIAVRDTDGKLMRETIRDHNNIFHTIARKLLPAAALRAGAATIITLGDILENYERETDTQDARREITAGTVRDRVQCIKNLRTYLPFVIPLSTEAESFGRTAALNYVRERRARSTTGGHRPKRELAVLARAAGYAGVRFKWELFRLNIKTAKMARRKFKIQEVLSWIQALPEPHKTILMMKFRTGAHNVELATQTVGMVKFADGGWFIDVRKKKAGEIRRHWQRLSQEALDDLRPFCAGKTQDALLFTRPDGRRIDDVWMQYQLKKASVIVGLGCACSDQQCDKPKEIRSYGFLRRMVATYLVWKMGTEEAKRFIGHDSVTTTERYNSPEEFEEIGLALNNETQRAADVMELLVHRRAG